MTAENFTLTYPSSIIILSMNHIIREWVNYLLAMVVQFAKIWAFFAHVRCGTLRSVPSKQRSWRVCHCIISLQPNWIIYSCHMLNTGGNWRSLRLTFSLKHQGSIIPAKEITEHIVALDECKYLWWMLFGCLEHMNKTNELSFNEEQPQYSVKHFVVLYGDVGVSVYHMLDYGRFYFVCCSLFL